MKIRSLAILAAGILTLTTFELSFAKSVNITVHVSSSNSQGQRLLYAGKGLRFKANDTDTLGDIIQQIQGLYNEQYSYQPGQVKDFVIIGSNGKPTSIDQSDYNTKISDLGKDNSMQVYATVYLS